MIQQTAAWCCDERERYGVGTNSCFLSPKLASAVTGAVKIPRQPQRRAISYPSNFSIAQSNLLLIFVLFPDVPLLERLQYWRGVAQLAQLDNGYSRKQLVHLRDLHHRDEIY